MYSPVTFPAGLFRKFVLEEVARVDKLVCGVLWDCLTAYL